MILVLDERSKMAGMPVWPKQETNQNIPDIIDWHVLVQVRNCIGMECIEIEIRFFLKNLLP